MTYYQCTRNGLAKELYADLMVGRFVDRGVVAVDFGVAGAVLAVVVDDAADGNIS